MDFARTLTIGWLGWSTASASLPQPPLSPAEALAAFRLPDGFSIQLIVAEPDVQDPINLAWGADGSLWVVEMGDYPLGINGKPGGRIRHFSGPRKDGGFSRSDLFLDGLSFPTAVMPWRKGVLVCAAPDVFYAEDKDGDGRADFREILFTGFREGNQQHRVNGLQWGLDGWVYLANGDSGGEIKSIKTGQSVSLRGHDLRIRPDTGEMELETGQTQYGRTRDDWDNWFGCNNSARWHYVLPEAYLRRNPRFIPAPGRKMFEPNLIYPAARLSNHSTIYNKPDEPGAEYFTSACSPAIYRDDRFGPSFPPSLFICDPARNVVHRDLLIPEGPSFRAARAASEAHTEFVVTRDAWFRPTCVKTGPDGALWLVDMYRLVIEHPEWIPPQLQQEIDLRAGSDRGRIYRIVSRSSAPREISPLSAGQPRQWSEALRSPNGWLRDTAQQLFYWTQDRSQVPALRKLSAEGPRPQTRVQSLWTLELLGSLGDAEILSGLSDPDPGVRRTAVRLSERRLNNAGMALGSRFAEMCRTEKDSTVLMQLAFSVGEWTNAQASAAIHNLTPRCIENDYLRTALFSSAAPHAAALLAALVDHPRPEITSPYWGKVLAWLPAETANPVVANIFRDLLKADSPRREPWRFAALGELISCIEKKDVSVEQLESPGHSDPLAATLTRASDSARRMAADQNEKIAARIFAIAFLGRISSQRGEDGRVLVTLLGPQNDSAIHEAVLQELERINWPGAGEELLAKWRELSPALRKSVFDLLMTRGRWVEQFLESAEADRSFFKSLDPARRQRLLASPSDLIRKRALALADGVARKDIDQILADYRAPASTPGDPAPGAEIFKNLCSSCHQLDGVGRAVGPDLATIRDKTPEALLLAILDPNRAVEDRYVQFNLETRDGRMLSGIIVDESPAGFTLGAADGTRQTVLRQDLTRFRSSGLSLMPEGFEGSITPAQMRDLIAFLAGPRKK